MRHSSTYFFRTLLLLFGLLATGAPLFAQQNPFESSGLLELECAGVGANLLQTTLAGASRGVAVSAGAIVQEENRTENGDLLVEAADYARVELPTVGGRDLYTLYLRVAPGTEEVYIRTDDGSWDLGLLDSDAPPSNDGWRWLEVATANPLPTTVDIAFLKAGDAVDQLFYKPANGLFGRESVFPNGTEGSNCADFNNLPPVIGLKISGTSNLGREIYALNSIELNAEGSSDPDGGPLAYYFSPSGTTTIGGGTTIMDINGNGDFTVGVIVWDFHGARSQEFRKYRGVPFVFDETGRTSYRLLPECAVTGAGYRLETENGTSRLVGDARSSTATPPADLPENRITYVIPNVSASDAREYYLTGSFTSAAAEAGDCIWARINGGGWTKWDILEAFSYFPKFGVPLTAGRNTVEFAYCSPALGIRDFILSPDTRLLGGNDPVKLMDVTCSDDGLRAGWLDAECADYGSIWRATGDPTAAGGAYLVEKGLNSLSIPPANDPANQIRFTLMELDVAAGTPLYLYARIDAPTGDDDSFWVRLNGGEWYAWRSGIRQGKGFVWNRYPAALTAVAGTNVLEFAYREDGTRLDRIYYSTEDVLPTDMPTSGDNCPMPGATVALEAECGIASPGWRQTTPSSASGDGLLTFVGRSNFQRPTGMSAEAVTYSVSELTGGTYRLFLRVDARDVGRNSVWVRIDDGAWVQMWQEIGGAELLTDGFEWREVNESGTAVPFELAAGAHTIAIANRESGTRIDKLQLSLSETTPTGFGAAATNCTSAAPAAAVVSPALQSPRLEVATGRPLAVFPNPTAGQLRLAWGSAYRGRVEVMVYDLYGRSLRQAAYEKAAGEFNTSLDVSDLPAGTYRLQLFEGDRRTVVPFVRSR